MMARLWLSLLVLLAVPAVRAAIASSDIYVIDGETIAVHGNTILDNDARN